MALPLQDAVELVDDVAEGAVEVLVLGLQGADALGLADGEVEHRAGEGEHHVAEDAGDGPPEQAVLGGDAGGVAVGFHAGEITMRGVALRGRLGAWRRKG
jgi:hypothetical protein